MGSCLSYRLKPAVTEHASREEPSVTPHSEISPPVETVSRRPNSGQRFFTSCGNVRLKAGTAGYGRAHLQSARLGCRVAAGDVAVRARVLCIVSAVALALPLGGCILTRDPYVSTAQPVPAGSWRVDRQVDRVSGTAISSAVANGRASNTNAAFPQNAIVQLSCFIDKPVVSFRFEFKVGSDRNSFLGYRFDEKPGHETNARFLANALTVVIDDHAEVAQFARDLAEATPSLSEFDHSTPAARPPSSRSTAAKRLSRLPMPPVP
jgi:hypothetical protein